VGQFAFLRKSAISEPHADHANSGNENYQSKPRETIAAALPNQAQTKKQRRQGKPAHCGP
jgi:hypothetical protein